MLRVDGRRIIGDLNDAHGENSPDKGLACGESRHSGMPPINYLVINIHCLFKLKFHVSGAMTVENEAELADTNDVICQDCKFLLFT